MKKSQRIGIYGLCNYNGKIVAIKKKRGPFTGKLDLPGGKLEHGELHIDGLKRELEEELGLQKHDFKVGKILGVWEDFSKHNWNGEDYDEHIIAIMYEVEILKLDIDFVETGGDSEKIYLLEKDDETFDKTNIFDNVLAYYNSKK